MNDQNKTSARGDMADEPIMINGRFYYTAEQMRRGCISNPGAFTGGEVARDAEIRDLRAALNLAQAEIKQWKATNDDMVRLQNKPALKRLNDVQWMNIVNHEHAWNFYSKDDAINGVFKMVEDKLMEINS